jgi:hypothetical protein
MQELNHSLQVLTFPRLAQAILRELQTGTASDMGSGPLGAGLWVPSIPPRLHAPVLSPAKLTSQAETAQKAGCPKGKQLPAAGRPSPLSSSALGLQCAQDQSLFFSGPRVLMMQPKGDAHQCQGLTFMGAGSELKHLNSNTSPQSPHPGPEEGSSTELHRGPWGHPRSSHCKANRRLS